MLILTIRKKCPLELTSYSTMLQQLLLLSNKKSNKNACVSDRIGLHKYTELFLFKIEIHGIFFVFQSIVFVVREPAVRFV